MRKISPWFSALILAFLVSAPAPARAQDAATQQQLDKLSAQLQDLSEIQSQQSKRLDAVEQKLNDLSDKVNSQPAANNYANADDLKKLADQIQEIDRKRQDDNQKILVTLEKLGKASAESGSHRGHAADATPPPDSGDNTPPPTGPQKGYYYTVKSGDYLSTIVKEYRANGVKVTTAQVLAANPGLDPAKLYIGKKIFIPDPNAK